MKEKIKGFRSYRAAFICLIGIGAVLLLAGPRFLPRRQGDPLIRAIANGQFYIEGYLGHFESGEVCFRQFAEYKTGEEHGVRNLDRAYYAAGSRYYYGEDEEGRRSLIPEEHDPEGIFSRESVFSNRDFSELRFCCEGSEEITDIETMEHFFCHYEEYRFQDTEDRVRLYFRGEKLYAMRTREDARYILYVSVFSEDPQPYVDEMSVK